MNSNDLKQISEVLDQKLDEKLNQKLEPITKNIKSMQSDLGKVQKDVRVMLAVLDRADVELYKRVERIEEHLGLSKLQ